MQKLSQCLPLSVMVITLFLPSFTAAQDHPAFEHPFPACLGQVFNRVPKEFASITVKARFLFDLPRGDSVHTEMVWGEARNGEDAIAVQPWGCCKGIDVVVWVNDTLFDPETPAETMKKEIEEKTCLVRQTWTLQLKKSLPIGGMHRSIHQLLELVEN